MDKIETNIDSTVNATDTEKEDSTLPSGVVLLDTAYNLTQTPEKEADIAVKEIDLHEVNTNPNGADNNIRTEPVKTGTDNCKIAFCYSASLSSEPMENHNTGSSSAAPCDNEKLKKVMWKPSFTVDAHVEPSASLSFNPTEMPQAEIPPNQLTTTENNVEQHVVVTSQRRVGVSDAGRVSQANPEEARSCTTLVSYRPMCDICGRIFRNLTYLRFHLTIHGNRKRFVRKVRGQGHKSNCHKDRHSNNQKLLCGVCDKAFSIQSKLNEHMNVHFEPQFSCSLCSARFKNVSSLRVHEKIHTESKEHVCDCGLIFRSETYLKRHVKNMHKHQVQSYKCLVCGLNMRSKINLEKHTQDHSSGSLQLSSANSQLVNHQSLVQQNQGSAMPEQQENQDCNMCTKKYRSKRGLAIHLQTHQEKRRFSCTICGKLFHRRDVLNNHLFLHSEERPFPCVICGKAFATKSNLVSHKKIHLSGSAAFLCHKCGATFHLKSTYIYHLKSHEGNFVFECGKCGKEFVRKCHFDEHLRSHSSLRPHVCSTCGKAFKERKQLRSHVKHTHASKLNLQTLVDSITPDNTEMNCPRSTTAPDIILAAAAAAGILSLYEDKPDSPNNSHM